MELFLFQSMKLGGALAIDQRGAALPLVPGGWQALGSLGNFSDQLDAEALARLKADGYLLMERDDRPPSRAADWQPFPARSFRLTDSALKLARICHDEINQRTGDQNILAFCWSPTSVKDQNELDWRDLGTQLILGSYSAAEIPADAVEHIEGLPIVFLFDPSKLPTPRPTTIDAGPAGFVFAD